MASKGPNKANAKKRQSTRKPGPFYKRYATELTAAGVLLMLGGAVFAMIASVPETPLPISESAAERDKSLGFRVALIHEVMTTPNEDFPVLLQAVDPGDRTKDCFLAGKATLDPAIQRVRVPLAGLSCIENGAPREYRIPSGLELHTACDEPGVPAMGCDANGCERGLVEPRGRLYAGNPC